MCNPRVFKRRQEINSQLIDLQDMKNTSWKDIRWPMIHASRWSFPHFLRSSEYVPACLSAAGNRGGGGVVLRGVTLDVVGVVNDEVSVPHHRKVHGQVADVVALVVVLKAQRDTKVLSNRRARERFPRRQPLVNPRRRQNTSAPARNAATFRDYFVSSGILRRVPRGSLGVERHTLSPPPVNCCQVFFSKEFDSNYFREKRRKTLFHPRAQVRWRDACGLLVS